MYAQSALPGLQKIATAPPFSNHSDQVCIEAYESPVPCSGESSLVYNAKGQSIHHIHKSSGLNAGLVRRQSIDVLRRKACYHSIAMDAEKDSLADRKKRS